MQESKGYLRHIVQTFKCKDLLSSQSLITIEADCSFTEACKTLITHKISSAPVFDSKTETYIGMFDYRDVVEYLLILFKKRSHSPTPSLDEQLYESALAGEPTSVKVASDISGKNPFYSLSRDSSIFSAIELLSNAGIHRVNIIDDSARVVGLLSQSDLIRWLWGHAAGLGAIFGQTLTALGLVKSLNGHQGGGGVRIGLLKQPHSQPSTAPSSTSPSSLYCVDGESSVIDALKYMSDMQITGVAVLDSSSSSIIGIISMTDVRMIFQRNQYMDLFMSCAQWISAVLSQAGLENEGRDRCPVFWVREESTLGETLQKILVTRVHRIWVESGAEAGGVVGVVSLGDVLKVILQHCYESNLGAE
jgi:CBS domain-containing protein